MTGSCVVWMESHCVNVTSSCVAWKESHCVNVTGNCVVWKERSLIVLGSTDTEPMNNLIRHVSYILRMPSLEKGQ